MQPEKKVAEIRDIVKAMKKNKRPVNNKRPLIKIYAPRTLSLISFALTQTLSQICRILQPYGPEFTLEYSAFQQAY